MTSKFNLSDWALRHKSFIVYLMLVSAIVGLFSYDKLGREEDPPFTIKTMVVQAMWPGATTTETLEQITDRIEKKLEEIEYLDFVRSYTKPGETTVFVNLKDSTPASKVPDMWYQVRTKINDIKSTFPQGMVGPFFNDEFGDTYGIVYAFTSDGFTHRELRDQLEKVRSQVLQVPDVAKVNFLGTQDEKIYLEFSTKQMAAMGINTNTVISTLQDQNAIVPSGVIHTQNERIAVRVSGSFKSAESLEKLNLKANNRFYRLTDIATIKRGYVDPPQPLFRYNGQAAIGLSISMKSGGDILALGEAMKEKIAQITNDLPIGIDVHLVANQPQVVDEAVSEFTLRLAEAIGIVLAVSFFALGMRAGIVVAVAIPLVLAITFYVMLFFDISLQRISLGALIIALGLLVDDAMIAVEMMITKLEEGADKVTAATYTYTSTAFPMLTGTLVTIAGFIPVGFAKSGAGEYTFTLFAVVAVALVTSWFVAVLFTPLTGVYLLPDKMKHEDDHKEAAYLGYFRRFLEQMLRFKYLVLGGTLALFILSVVGMGFVQQQFFPASDRPELLVNVTLPKNASIYATRKTVNRIEKIFKNEKDIDYWTFYIGQGAVRFYLPLDPQLTNEYFAQAVVVTKGFEERDAVKKRLEKALSIGFEDALVRVSALELGPPVGWPLKFRVSGPDPDKVRATTFSFTELIAKNPSVSNINYDWNEQSKRIAVNVDQERARQLGLSSSQLASAINAVMSGQTITKLKDDIYLIDIVGRANDKERATLQTLRNLTIAIPSGRNVPLAQIASLSYRTEQSLIWRRNRLPTITIQADIPGGVQPTTVTTQLDKEIKAFQAKLPAGYAVAVGGSTEDGAKAQNSIFAVAPLMLFVMITLLMIQLMSFQRLIIVLITAPLALIGVSAALLIFDKPMGFVTILGILSLAGMVIRNSVILIVKIDSEIAEGHPPWEGVINATVHRLRPILLTAAAAILAMVPISHSVFWGPMAYAVMGGLAVATLLTLVFLPALYVAWFRIKPAQN